MGLMPRDLLYIDVDLKSYIVKYLTSPTPWLDPGSIIALATVDCQTANLAWDVFRDILHYYFDSEDSILQLKLKCFHFQTWARNSGLTECKLSNGLLLIYETVERTLHLTSQLFENAGQLRGRYGLSIAMSNSAADKPDKISDASIEEKISKRKRLRWAVHDKQQFRKLMSDLESYVENLNQLLTETRRVSLGDDQKSIKIVFMGIDSSS
ncbi:hypothetical protein FQN53_001424 [Emmonsiellopsis sp. PD_33]|nr:hypothetical protein FQN53_001424 [Emmonsiellopsis sp. PD_33]